MFLHTFSVALPRLNCVVTGEFVEPLLYHYKPILGIEVEVDIMHDPSNTKKQEREKNDASNMEVSLTRLSHPGK
jgi:hypothetical protein